MLWTALGDALPQAFGIAISPIPVVLVILMLVSSRAKVNGPLFLAGWMLGAALVTGLGYVLADAAEADQGGAGSDGVAIGQLLFGLLFLVLAARQWRSRPAAGEEPPTPKLFAAVDTMGPLKVCGLAFVACAVNPKNLPLAASGGATLAGAGLSTGQAIVAELIFVLIASASIIAPVVVYLALGDRSAEVLSGWKTWLVANNSTVMTVLFAVLGAKMLGAGLGLFA